MSRRGENIYKRKDGRWEGRGLKPDGKYRYFYARTYREVKEKMKSFQKDCTQTGKTQAKTENAVVLFASWLENDVAQHVKPSTYENYYCCMKKHILPFFQREENRRINENTASRFSQSIRENPSLSETYKKKILSIFKTALRQILKGTAEQAAVIDAVKLPKTREKEVQVFSMNEQRLIENIVLHSEDKRLIGICLCFYTGIRLGELCGLRWSDFDLEAGTMSVMRTVYRTKNFQSEGKKTLLHVGTPKSRKSRRKIPLPAFLLTSIGEKRAGCRNESDYMLSDTNIPMDPRTYQKLFKKTLMDAKVRDNKFHTIRHTFATRALALGVDIKTLSEILGHSNVSITLNVYAHSLMEQKKIAIKKFDDMHNTQMAREPFAVASSVILV